MPAQQSGLWAFINIFILKVRKADFNVELREQKETFLNIKRTEIHKSNLLLLI